MTTQKLTTKTTETKQTYTIAEIKKAIESIGITTRPGLYTMDMNIYFIGLEHFLKTQENVLSQYDRIIWTTWEKNDFQTMNNNSLYVDEENEDLFKNRGFWDVYSILSKETVTNILITIENSKRRLEYRKTYEYRRKVASIYISNPKIRKEVFLKNGKICSKCGSKKKLSLDHIISVAKGGENTIENLQVLCVSCNSAKGVQ